MNLRELHNTTVKDRPIPKIPLTFRIPARYLFALVWFQFSVNYYSCHIIHDCIHEMNSICKTRTPREANRVHLKDITLKIHPRHVPIKIVNTNPEIERA